MKRINFIALLLLAFVLQVAAQETKNYEIASFNELAISVPADVEIRQGAASLAITGPPELLDMLIVKNKDQRLKIKYRRGVSKSKRLTIVLSMPNVNVVDLSGSVSVNGVGNIRTDKLELNMSGSCKLAMQNLEAKRLEINISGSGKLSFAGEATAEYVELNISGSGKMDSENFACSAMEVNISGSGKANVNVIEKLDVSISGHGKVLYKGRPSVNSSISGSGSLRTL